MELEMIFAILGIEVTKEKALIQSAYRMKLVDNNPEDHPEEFMRLRQAFEAAMNFADAPDEDVEEEEDDDSPVGIWMTKVKSVYSSIKRRIDVNCWRELLNDEVCFDLEYSEEARRRLFIYLMDCFQLTIAVYKLLDEKLGIEENKEEMYEYLPVQFVDYMISKIHTEDEQRQFSYEWLDGPDGADFDGFVQQVEGFERLIYEDQNQAFEVLDALKATGITHPYVDIYEASLLAKTDGGEDAILIARETIKNNPDSVRILVLGAEAIYLSGEKEEGIELFKRAQDKEGILYISSKYFAIDALDKGDYVAAIKHCKDAANDYSCEEIAVLSDKIDNEYLGVMADKIENDQVPTAEISVVIRAMLRTEQADKALKYITDYPHVLEDIPYGESYRIDVLSCSGNNIEAIERIDKYIDELIACKVENDEEWEGAFKRATYYGAKAYQNKGTLLKKDRSKKHIDQLIDAKSKTKDGFIPHTSIDINKTYEPKDGWENIVSVNDKDKYLFNRKNYREDFTNAVKYLEMFVEEFPYDANAQLEIIVTELMAQNYDIVVKRCDDFLANYPDYFPVLTYKQQACYELDMAQEVIDLYHQCRNIFAGYYRIYEFAAKIFAVYNQNEDALEVINTARQNDVNELMLDVIEYKIQVGMARSKETIEEYESVITIDPLKLMNELLTETQELSPYDNTEKISELFYAMAMNEEARQNLMSEDEITEENERLDYYFIQHSVGVSLNPEPRFYSYGYYCRACGSYAEAARFYRLFLETHPDHLDAMFHLANSLQSLDRYTGNSSYALAEGNEWYEKILAVAPDFRDVAGRASFYYNKLYSKTGIKKYIYRAVELARIQAESENSEDYDILQYGKYLCEIGQYKAASEQLIKVLDNKDLGLEAHKLYGQCLRSLGQYDESVSILRKALKQAKDNEIESVWSELMSTYKRGYDFKTVEKAYKEAVKTGHYCYGVAYDYYNALVATDKFEEAVKFLKDDIKRSEKVSSEDVSYAFSDRFTKSRLYWLDIRIAHRDKTNLSEINDRIMETYKIHPYKKGNDTIVELLGYELAKYYAYVEPNVNRVYGYMKKYFECIKADNTNKYFTHYWNKKQEAEVCFNPYNDSSSKYLFLMRVARMNGDKEKIESVRKELIEHLCTEYGGENEEQAIERFAFAPTWRLSRITDIVEFYVSIDDKENAKKWFDKMCKCEMCGECSSFGNECDEIYEYMAIYYEYIGENELAMEYYEKAYKADMTTGLPYYRLKNRLEIM